MSKVLGCAALSVATVLASCGGGGSKMTNPVQGASPGGVWRATESVTGLAVTGLIDEAGNSTFIRADHTEFVGTATTLGNSITVSDQGYPVGAFPDGSDHGSGTIQGTIKERQSISATYEFTTDAGTTPARTRISWP